MEVDSSDDVSRAILSRYMGRDKDRPELIAVMPLAAITGAARCRCPSVSGRAHDRPPRATALKSP